MIEQIALGQNESNQETYTYNAHIPVGIILSTYNGQQYIREQLDSLLRQSHHNIHIIIRDDGSTDSTVDILDEYASMHSNITLIRGANIGVTESFFELLRSYGPQFEFVSFCDQDDIWNENKVELGIRAIVHQGTQDRPMLYFSRLEYVDGSLNSLGFSLRPKNIGVANALVENIAAGCTSIMNRAAVIAIISRLPERCFIHDWWFYLVVSAIGDVIYDPTVTMRYRQHSANAIGGSPSLWRLVLRRLQRYVRLRGNTYRPHAQAIACLDLYRDQMSEENKQKITKFVESKRNILTTLAYLGDKDRAVRQRIIDDLALKAALLFKAY